MQENNTRLIDEALAVEPVKNTFRLAWEFIHLNKKLTLTSMGIFIILNLLNVIPLLALVSMVLSAVFGVVIQIHIGRTLYSTQNIETYVNEIQKSQLPEIWKEHVKTAFGVYLGWIVLVVLMVVALSIIGMMTGILNQNMNENDMLMAMIELGTPLIILGLLFSYVQPLVHSNIVLARSFEEGFKAVFTLFSKDIWASSFQKSYFIYISKVGLIVILLLVSLSILIGLVVSLPILGSLLSIAFLVLMYLFMVFMSIMAMMARRVIEE